MSRKLPSFDVAKVAKAIKWPASTWAGNCYAIACAMVQRGVVDGTAVYGHWTGPVHRRSMFAGRRVLGWCNHGWISLPDRTVVDPTRFAFEARDPYIFVGHPEDAEVPCLDFAPSGDALNPVCTACGHVYDEHEQGSFFKPCRICIEWPYDEGGNKLRASLQKPCPPAKKGERRYPVSGARGTLPSLRSEVCMFFARLTNDGGTAVLGLTQDQCFWLANLPLDVLDQFAEEVYDWLKFHRLGAYIPVDNLHAVQRKRKVK